MLGLILQGVLAIAAGVAIGVALSYAIDHAKEWFCAVWKSLRNVKKGVGVLVLVGRRLFKRFVAFLTNGKSEEYVEEGDEGVEYDVSKVPEEVKKAFREDGYLVVEVYG